MRRNLKKIGGFKAYSAVCETIVNLIRDFKNKLDCYLFRFNYNLLVINNITKIVFFLISIVLRKISVDFPQNEFIIS